MAGLCASMRTPAIQSRLSQHARSYATSSPSDFDNFDSPESSKRRLTAAEMQDAAPLQRPPLYSAELLGPRAARKAARRPSSDDQSPSRKSGEFRGSPVWKQLKGISLRLPADSSVPGWSRPHHVSITWSWLRDSCRCASCVQPSTKQKLHRSSTYDVNDEERLVQQLVERKASIEVIDGVPSLKIVWDAKSEEREPWRQEPEHADVPLEPHTSIFPLTWIRQHAPHRPVFESSYLMSPKQWDVKTLNASPTLRIPFDLFKSSPAHLHAALAQVQVYGLVVLTGVPTDKTSDAECELRQAMQRVGEIRNTFYGSTWDVKAIKDSKNIAYTNVDLGVHMDLL